MPLRREPEGEESEPEEVEQSSRRYSTETTLKPQGPRKFCDSILDLFVDGRFHSANELETYSKTLKKEGQWVLALREVIEYGYSFGRRSHSLILRKRSMSEKKQDVMTLLAGIDATLVEDINKIFDSEKATTAVMRHQGMTTPQDEEGCEPQIRAHDGLGDEMAQEPFSEPPTATSEMCFSIAVRDSDIRLAALEAVTATWAILAQKRSGKSYLAMVIAEEFLRYKLPFVAIDPTGVWYGLRSLMNGDPSPFTPLILGGQRGDFPLLPTTGKVVAKLVKDIYPNPMILDVSDMLPEEQHEFVADFGAELFRTNREPIQLFVDEADEFMPQSPDNTYKHQRRSLNVMDRLVRRGGNRGLGCTPITQRPAVIHKNILSQARRYFFLKMAAPHDLQAVENWISPVLTATTRVQCLSALPKLPRGEVYSVSSGADSGICNFMTRPKMTFDSSYTPIYQEKVIEPRLSEVEFRVLEIAALALGQKTPEHHRESEDRELREELGGDDDGQADS